MSERELTQPVAVADAAGRLRPEAIGWSRQPLHQCNFAHQPRAHAFDYWCVASREVALTLLVADVGLAGVALVSALDLTDERMVERRYLRPRGLSVPMPPGTDGEVVLDGWRLQLAVGPDRLVAHARTLTGRRIDAEVAVERPPGHETVNVLVPWSDTQYHVTSKQHGLPARGELVVDGRRYRLDETTDAFAARDFGRGRRPDGIDWAWAFTSWRVDGRVLGLNLGAGWTDGTGVSENAIIVDGRVHKIADAIDVEVDRGDARAPWRIRTRTTNRVDLRFVPITLRPVTIPPVVRLRQCMGHFTGTVIDDHDRAIAVIGALGLAETVRGRW
jgi:hypothetical protein